MGFGDSSIILFNVDRSKSPRKWKQKKFNIKSLWKPKEMEIIKAFAESSHAAYMAFCVY